MQLWVDRIESVDMRQFNAVLTKRLAPHFPRHKVDAMVICNSNFEQLCYANANIPYILLNRAGFSQNGNSDIKPANL
jgi:hypothetical protein